jgi:2-iminobutanoate/2-iminopropanoate deaminase
MNREVVRPWPLQPEDNVPFVPAIKLTGQGTLLFMSGTGPLPASHKHPHVPEEWVLPDDVTEQAYRTFKKIRMVVEHAGGEISNVVKITRYLKDMADQDALNIVIHEIFGKSLPCSTTVQVVGFVVPTMKLEIDAWAVIPDGVGAK